MNKNLTNKTNTNKTRTLQEIFNLCIKNGHLESEVFMCHALKEAVKAGTITQKECEKATKSIRNFFHYCSEKSPIIRGAEICTLTSLLTYLSIAEKLTEKGQQLCNNKSSYLIRLALFSNWANRYNLIQK